MPITQSNNIGFGNYGIYNSKNIGYRGMGIYSPELSQSDPILQALIDSSSWLLYGDMATGTSEGVNSPLTNPIKDLKGTNDGTLTNFVGTELSGYKQVVAPNSKTVTGIQGDEVDDYIIANDSYNPTGLDEFGLGFIIKTNSMSGFLFCKGPIVTAQLSLYHYTTTRLALRVGGSFTTTASGVIPTKDTFYKVTLCRKDGSLIIKVNGVEKYNVANTINIIERDNTRLLSANTDAIGMAQEGFCDSTLFAFSTCPINGDLTTWEEKFNAFALDKYGL